VLGSLLFGLLAGWLVTRAEPLMEDVVERLAGRELRIDALDFRVLTLLALLALASIGVVLVRGDASLFLASLGAGLGYFGPQLWAFFQDPDGAMGAAEDDWDGRIAPGTFDDRASPSAERDARRAGAPAPGDDKERER